MTLHIEKATYSWDLPHDYDEVSSAQRECSCGRERAHQLHGVPATEQAAHRPLMATEKGSPVFDKSTFSNTSRGI